MHIPRRLDDGYGISAGSRAAEAFQPDVFITVDCGISDQEWLPQIAAATGCTTIVTLPPPSRQRSLPPADFIVNPNRQDCPSQAKELAGVGVAWMLAWATAREACGSNELPDKLRQLLLESLSLVALGTIADYAPLIGNNRILVHHGLKALERSQPPGRPGPLTKLQSLGVNHSPLTTSSWKLSPF